MVRMPLTQTPGALVLAFHVRCYTTDSKKRWEFCETPICAAAANGKFSYTGCFFNWYPPKKVKYGKPRLGESTLT